MKKKFLLMVISTNPHECYLGDTVEAETMADAISILTPNLKFIFNDKGYGLINDTNFYQVIEL